MVKGTCLWSCRRLKGRDWGTKYCWSETRCLVDWEMMEDVMEMKKRHWYERQKKKTYREKMKGRGKQKERNWEETDELMNKTQMKTIYRKSKMKEENGTEVKGEKRKKNC